MSVPIFKKFKIIEMKGIDVLINMIADLIISVFNNIINVLEKLTNVSNIIQGIVIALLTILIPLAIAILADVYQRRREKKIEFIDLDLHVILDHVFKIKLIILYLFLIFLPIFFWDISLQWVKLVEIILSFFGILLIIKIIIKIYYWVKGNVFKYRFSYLENLKNYSDLEIVYRSVWQAKNINIQNEREFFKIFSITIDQLSKSTKKNLKTISKLLNDFYNFINNRSIAFLVVPEDVFPKILDWHFRVWQKEYALLDIKLLDKKDKLNKWSNYGEILRILDDILSNIEERSLKERMAYSFFVHFEKHAERYKEKLIKSNERRHYYIDHLLDIFCRVFFKNIEKSPEKHDIWEHYFPEGWKIKKSNFEKNIITKKLCSKFLKWARDIVLDDKKEFARDLGKISSNLFSEVEPFLWIDILLLFCFSHYKDNESKMKSILDIEHSWDFRIIGRIIIGDDEESLKKIEEVVIKNTFELTFQLFKEQFSKDNLEKYIKSLRELEPEYKDDPKKEEKRLKLLNTYERILEFLENQENKK